MATGNAPFIPAVDLAALSQGSHQDMAVRLATALKGEAKRFSGESAAILATFDTHVVVMTEGGSVFRLQYERAANGDIHFVKQEAVDVPVVTDRSVRQYVRSQAYEAVDLFLKGLVSQAHSKIAAILPLADASMANSDAESLAAFMESRKTQGGWQRFMAGRKPQVLEYLGENSIPAPLQPKFKKLYDGATGADELPNFKGLVQSDMTTLVTRLVAVEEQARTALEMFRSVRASAGNGDHPALSQLEAYANDLLADVTQVKSFAEEASGNFKQVDLLAKVFDSMSAEVASLEVAGAFAAKMASRLAEASR